MLSISFWVKPSTFTAAYKALNSLNPFPISSLPPVLCSNCWPCYSSCKHCIPTSGSLYLLFPLLGRLLPPRIEFPASFSCKSFFRCYLLGETWPPCLKWSTPLALFPGSFYKVPTNFDYLYNLLWVLQFINYRQKW